MAERGRIYRWARNRSMGDAKARPVIVIAPDAATEVLERWVVVPISSDRRLKDHPLAVPLSPGQGTGLERNSFAMAWIFRCWKRGWKTEAPVACGPWPPFSGPWSGVGSPLPWWASAGSAGWRAAAVNLAPWMRPGIVGSGRRRAVPTKTPIQPRRG